MKRSWLKRKTPLKAKNGFKVTRSALRKVGKDTVSEVKVRIQALLRKLAIQRDGGCVLRHYGDCGACGGYKMDGELVLQAEHLVTRSNSISFGDMRNIVCLCRNHHSFFKPKYSRLYWEIIEKHIGEERWKWIKKVEADKKAHRFTLYDWQKIEMSLTQELWPT